MKYDTIKWEDVKVEQQITPLEMKVTYARMIADIGESKNLAAIHHNPVFAKASGNRDMFVETPWINGLMFRLITDWTGPEAWITRYRINMRESNCPGDLMKCTGTVTKKYIRGGKALVDVHFNIDNQLFHTQDGDFTVELPTRGPTPPDTTEGPDPWTRDIGIAPDLGEETLHAIGREKRSKLSEMEVNKWIIRNRLVPIEDGNPVYWDEEFAKKSRFGGLICPPHMSGFWLNTPPWPVTFPKSEDEPLPILSQYGFQVVAAPYDEYYRPLYYGDRVYTVSKMTGMTGERTTRRGVGRFWTSESSLYNQRDELISKGFSSLFRYNRPREGPEPRTRSWNEVSANEILPDHKQPIQHVQPPAMLRTFAENYIKEWTGPEARIKDIDYEALEVGAFSWNGPGSIVTFSGKVTGKRQEGSNNLVDLEGQSTNYGWPTARFKATVELP